MHLEKKQYHPTKTDWWVFNQDFNRHEIVLVNVMEYIEPEIKNWRTKNKRNKIIWTIDEFAEKLKRECMYRFWSKCEYEIILDGWPSGKDFKQLKIDVWDQIEINWDKFLNMCWELYNIKRWTSCDK